MKSRIGMTWTSSLVAAGVLAAAFTMLFAGDCSGPIDATFVAPGENDGYTDPEELIAAHEWAWSHKNYGLYFDLLDAEFEFYPLQEDADDFAWLDGDSWDRTAELGMVQNMFDPSFSGGNGRTILIEFGTRPQTTILNDQGRIELSCLVVARVMWSPTDGATFDTRLNFELIERDGFLKILRIREVPRTGGRIDSPLGYKTIGRIKSMFHSGLTP